MESEKKERLNALLSHVHQWPSDYIFKFIYKSDPEIVKQLKAIFPVDSELKFKHSKKKNYESLNVKYLAKNADEILDIYNKVSKINDVISL